MRFIPESTTINYAHQYGKAKQTLGGHWPNENRELKLRLTEEREDEIPLYRFSLLAKEGCYVDRITLSGRIEGTLRPVSLLKEGYQSWSYCGVLKPDQRQQKPFASFVTASQEAVWNPPTGKPGAHTSDTMALLSDGLNPSLLIAQLPPFGEYVAVSVNSARQPVQISISWILQREFSAGEEYLGSRVSVSSGEAEEILRNWNLRAAGELDGPVRPEADPPRGWCSWYIYFNQISAAKIRGNLQAAKERQLPFEIFQIDDGWQRCIGDWLRTKESFENQMPLLAEEIRGAGYTPGLWLAPFAVTRDAPAFSNPGWVLRNDKGKPVKAGFNPAWKGTFYALDITHPEVIAHLGEVMRTLTGSWGYRYLKLDFLYAASLPGRRHDPTRTPAQVLASGLDLLRREAEPGVRFLGCGMPLAAGAGRVEAARVSCDVAPRWGQSQRDRLLRSDSNVETRGAIRDSILRSGYNKLFWHNDPDCLMLRTHNTALSPAERETHRMCVLYAGGSLFVSDDLENYGEEDTALLKETFAEADALGKGKTHPLRLFGNQEIYALYNDTGFLLLFNLRDAETAIELRLSGYRDLFRPFSSYRPFDGAEDHPLEAPRNIQLPARGFKRIQLSR
jgi:alpha-galactosidase